MWSWCYKKKRWKLCNIHVGRVSLELLWTLRPLALCEDDVICTNSLCIYILSDFMSTVDMSSEIVSAVDDCLALWQPCLSIFWLLSQLWEDLILWYHRYVWADGPQWYVHKSIWGTHVRSCTCGTWSHVGWCCRWLGGCNKIWWTWIHDTMNIVRCYATRLA